VTVARFGHPDRQVRDSQMAGAERRQDPGEAGDRGRKGSDDGFGGRCYAENGGLPGLPSNRGDFRCGGHGQDGLAFLRPRPAGSERCGLLGLRAVARMGHGKPGADI
jgi:hypothetical protein